MNDKVCAIDHAAIRLVEVRVRPLLVSGILAATEIGHPLILVDSEEPPREQAIALFHETLHLLGVRNEVVAETVARALAAAVPDILNIIPVKRGDA